MLASILKSMGKEGKDLAKEISSILIDRQTKSLFLLRLAEFKRETSKLKQQPKLAKVEKMVMEFVMEVKKGFLGKSKIEGVIYFMLPEDAVSHTLSVMGKLAGDIKTEDDILKICKDTGMPPMTVISVLNEMGY